MTSVHSNSSPRSPGRTRPEPSSTVEPSGSLSVIMGIGQSRSRIQSFGSTGSEGVKSTLPCSGSSLVLLPYKSRSLDGSCLPPSPAPATPPVGRPRKLLHAILPGGSCWRWFVFQSVSPIDALSWGIELDARSECGAWEIGEEILCAVPPGASLQFLFVFGGEFRFWLSCFEFKFAAFSQISRRIPSPLLSPNYVDVWVWYFFSKLSFISLKFHVD